MGRPVIETVRPGVQFTPEAAAAFRRAEAQVRAEFGRGIDVNSTYRDWDTQLRMYNAWQAYITGRGPYPGHSKALHPADPLAFHTKGLALDSDDWTNQRIVQILAEHGFIRNRLYVPNERHHFEYLRNKDKHINDPVPAGLKEDDMPLTEQDLGKIRDAVWGKHIHPGRTAQSVVKDLWWQLTAGIPKVKNHGDMYRWTKDVWWQLTKGVAGTKHHGEVYQMILETRAQVVATNAAVRALSESQGLDPEKIQATIDTAVRDALKDIEITLKSTVAKVS